MAKLSKHRSALSTNNEKKDCCARCYAKCYLVVINTLTMILACVLIYYGATTITITNRNKTIQAAANRTADMNINKTANVMPNESSLGASAKGATSLFENAWATVVFMGVALLVISFNGLAGSFATGRKRSYFLFTYLVLLMVFASGLLFSAFYCFFFSDNAEALVEYYWDYLSDGMPDNSTVKWIEQHMAVAGVVCLISAILLFVSMCATSQLLGHLYTFRNFMLVVNSATFIIGILVILLSVITGLEHLTGLWIPYFLAVLGSLMSTISGIGYCAVRKESSALMRCYFCSLIILIILFFVSSVLSFHYATQMRTVVKAEWSVLEDKIAPGYTEEDVEIIMSHHMYKLGIAAAIVVVVLLFNTCGSCYMYQRIRRAEAALDDEELEVLRLEEGIDTSDEEDD